MTLAALPWAQTSGLRRSTFVPSALGVAARRRFVAVTASAMVVSVAGLGVLAPLVF